MISERFFLFGCQVDSWDRFFVLTTNKLSIVARVDFILATVLPTLYYLAKKYCLLILNELEPSEFLKLVFMKEMVEFM